MSDEALVWGSVALGLLLLVLTVLLVWRVPALWWAVALFDTVVMTAGWSLMAANPDPTSYVGANMWPIGAALVALGTLPVAFVVCAATVVIRQPSRLRGSDPSGS